VPVKMQIAIDDEAQKISLFMYSRNMHN